MRLIRSQLKRLKIRQLLATVAIGVVLLLVTAFTQSESVLAANRSVKSNASDMSYRGSDVPDNASPDIGTVQQKSLPPLPNQKQPMIDRADPNSKVLERAGEAIQDASAFLKDTAKSASARPESQANPAIGQ